MIQLIVRKILLIGIVFGLIVPVQAEYIPLVNNDVMYAESPPPPIDISGIIRDSQGEALIGVNVLVKGSTKGTSTDVEGAFTLSDVAEDAILVISYVGYQTKEVPIDGRAIIQITLDEDLQQLEEVVVVGYGTQKKQDLTGAIDNVNFDKDVGTRPVANVQQMLQGLTPNLNLSINNGGGEPGATQNINIRGLGTLTGSGGEPYILLDGIPITVSEMNGINPSDISDISILKDAASAAIYGSRGAYGVILITTKRGEKREKVKFDISSNVAFASPTRLPEMMNSLQFIDAINTSNINAFGSPYYKDDVIQRTKDYIDGKLKTEAQPNETGTGWQSNANNDFYDIFFKENVPRQQHRVSLSGGSATNTFYLSGSYYDQIGNFNFADNEYDRFNFTGNWNSRVNDWLSFDMSAKYSKENRNFPSGGYGGYDKNIFYHQISRLRPIQGLYDPDGNLILADALRLQKSGYTDNVKNRTILQIGTNIEPVTGWVTRFTYNYKLNNENQKKTRLRNFLFQPDGTSDNVGFNPDDFSRYFESGNTQVMNVTTSYDKSIGGHNFVAMAGYEQQLVQWENLSGRKTNLITANIPTISTATGEDYIGDGASQYSQQGVFARLTYNYKSKYLVKATGRYDGSSFFREGKQWGFFPSVEVGYNIAKEEFWPVSSVNTFKLRANWGELGNHDPRLANRFVELLPSGSTSWLIGGQRPNVIRAPGIISPSLTWETVTTKNFGFDVALFENKIEGSFDLYNRTTSDMIGPVESLPEVLGVGAPAENNAALETRGWELSARYRGAVGKVSYRAGFNIGDNKTVVQKYRNPTGILSNWREGEEVGEIWGYTTVGYFKTDDEAENAPDQSLFWSRWGAGDVQYADVNGDGVINNGKNTLEDHGDLKIIGNNRPRYNFGINLGVNFAGFDLSLLFQGIGKRDFLFSRNSNLFYGFRGSQWQNSWITSALDYWTPENTDAYFPKPYLNNEHLKNTREQTKYLQDASYMRLKNIQLGYTLPSSVMNRVGLRNVQLVFSGENLLTFTKLWESYDPEALGGGWGQGKIFPLQKVLSVGLNVGL
ncbi:TonB-dependent receptor [Membranicola marinus]|uniref:TonB-dependent receptor n=1 Tax=Membranihabitans marinus TaxID=1227546 RepID=A0A953LC60_9BACT|nr:TonB-dependent receptor [Membranihabitans marinus]MBY5959201.1 TonB-dependent receptor [Membranihabitans marinus]